MSVFSQFINVAGNSFLAPNAPFVGYASGFYYPPSIPNYTLSSTKQSTSGRLYAMPFVARQTYTFSGIAIQQTSATTGNVRLGIYNASGNVPGTLLADGGAVAFPASSNVRTATVSIAVTKGSLYFLAAVFDTTGMQYVGPSNNDTQAWPLLYGELGFIPTAASFDPALAAYYVAQAYGALPTPFTVGTKVYDGNAPLLCLIG